MHPAQALATIALCLATSPQARGQAVGDLAICSDATLPTAGRVAELERRGWVDCQSTVPKADFLQAVDFLGVVDPTDLPAQRTLFDRIASRARTIGPSLDGAVMCLRSVRALVGTSKDGRPTCLFTSAEPQFDAFVGAMSLKADEAVGHKRSLRLRRPDVRISAYEFAEEWRPGFELAGGTMFVAYFINKDVSAEVSP